MNPTNPSTNPSISVIVPTFRPGPKELSALCQLVSLSNSISLISQIIVVNDSENTLPNSYLTILDKHPALIKLVEYGENKGRAYARNAGAQAAISDVLWFLDADCYCGITEARQIYNFDWNKCQVHYGQIRNTDSNQFWGRYQQTRRQSSNTNSSANLLITKSVFLHVGGYCEDYKKYGFEDRDLYEMLKEVSSILSHENFFVEHDGNVSFDSSRNKIFESAASGRIFARRYPKQYLKTLYGKIDAKYLNKQTYLLLNIASIAEQVLHPVTRFSVEVLPLPFPLKSILVKLSFACTYFRATKTI